MGWQGPKSLCLFTKIPGRVHLTQGQTSTETTGLFPVLCHTGMETGANFVSPNPSIDMETFRKFHSGRRVGGGSLSPVSPDPSCSGLMVDKKHRRLEDQREKTG